MTERPISISPELIKIYCDLCGELIENKEDGKYLPYECQFWHNYCLIAPEDE